jgi:hypothetical protein
MDVLKRMDEETVEQKIGMDWKKRQLTVIL